LKKDRTFWLFGAALLFVVFSYAEFIASVHTYCENRWQMIVLAICGLVLAGFAIKRWPEHLFRKVLSIATITMCVAAIGENVWFLVWATLSC